MMRSLLWPLGLLFSFLSWLRGKLFDWGILGQKKVDAPVICVGNISTGGTGKTPWVHALTDFLSKNHRNVTILSRGYSGDFDGVLKVSKDMDPRQCGDEPLWLLKNTNADVYVGRSRYHAALKAMAAGKVDVFLLDDGFQHRKFHRDLDIVLLDASAPKSNFRPLPVGYLRESLSALGRAHIILINKCNYSEDGQLKSLIQSCERHCSADRIYLSDFVFSHWSALVDGLPADVPEGPFSMTCGLGNPGAFIKTLSEQGIDPVKKFVFPDHYYWKPNDIERMTYNMQVENSHSLMITEKDAVKLHRYKKHFFEMKIQVWVCKMKIQLRDREDEFFKKVNQVFLPRP